MSGSSLLTPPLGLEVVAPVVGTDATVDTAAGRASSPKGWNMLTPDAHVILLGAHHPTEIPVPDSRPGQGTRLPPPRSQPHRNRKVSDCS